MTMNILVIAIITVALAQTSRTACCGSNKEKGVVRDPLLAKKPKYESTKLDQTDIEFKDAMNDSEIKQIITKKLKNGGSIIYFKEPPFNKIVDVKAVNLVWAIESWHPIVGLKYYLEITRENETATYVNHIRSSRIRNRGKYTIKDAKEGIYFVTVKAYKGKKGKRPKLVGEGYTFFIALKDTNSRRKTEFRFGATTQDKHGQQKIKQLDRMKLKPGNKMISIKENHDAEYYRIFVFTMEKGYFSREVFTVWRQVKEDGTEAQNPFQDQSDGIPAMEDAVQSTETRMYFTYYFFKKNSSGPFHSLYTHVLGTASVHRNGKEVMVAWGRAMVFGYWRKVIKDAIKITTAVTLIGAAAAGTTMFMGPQAGFTVIIVGAFVAKEIMGEKKCPVWWSAAEESLMSKLI